VTGIGDRIGGMTVVLGTVPGGGAALNPFLIVDDAARLIAFVEQVFDVTETPEAHSPLPDGKLIHSQIRLGTVDLMIVDRLEGWPARPGLLQVWVTDVAATLKRAESAGATIVTEATPFYGESTIGRFLDRWQNVWWLWAPAPGQPDPATDIMFTTLDATLRSMTR
jgi:PhnB protein